jgi:hypothetical protein
VLADDAIHLLPHTEIKLHLCVILALMNHIVISLGSGFPPQRPGHGINQSRLTVTIIATDAGGMDTSKIKGGHIIAVRHEVAYG